MMISITLCSFFPALAQARMIFYDPDFDVSMGIVSYLVEESSNNPEISPGLYFGGYLGMKSPLFANYFRTQRIYNLFEMGVALNEITLDTETGENDLLITVPFLIDFAYRIGITRRLLFYPFAGTGLSFTHIPKLSENNTNITPVLSLGVLLQYLLNNSSIKIKFDYGIALDNRTDSGIIQFIKVRFPVPFIP